jgi:hypothetical protein
VAGSRRALTGCAAVFVATTLIDTFAASKLRALERVAGAVSSSTVPGLARLHGLRDESLALDELTLRHLLANNLAEKHAIELDVDESARRIDEGLRVSEAAIETEAERRLYVALSENLGRVRHFRNEHLLPLSRAGRLDEARLVYDTDMASAREEYRHALAQLVMLQEEKGRSSATALETGVQANAWVIGLGALLTAMAAGGFAAAGISGRYLRPATVASPSADSLDDPWSAAIAGDVNDGLAASRELIGLLKTIDDIAVEANVIALNAAVEAARAGEPGIDAIGISGDIRRLTDCAATAGDAAAQLAQSVAASGDGVPALSMEAVRAIASQVFELKRMIDDVGERSGSSRLVPHAG